MRLIIQIIIMLIFFYLAAAANGQTVNLENIPDNFRFTANADEGAEGDFTVTYQGRDGELFKFQAELGNADGIIRTENTWITRDGHVARFEKPEKVEYLPHLCAPRVGICEYSIRFADGDTFALKRESYMVGEVWVDQLFYVDGAEFILGQISCKTIDAFGFSINSISVTTAGGPRKSARRVASSIPVDSTISFEELEKTCLTEIEGIL